MFVNTNASNTIENDNILRALPGNDKSGSLDSASVTNKKRRRKICVVCKKESIPGDNSRTFHSFPKNEDLRKKWINAIGVSYVNKSTLICSDHFESLSYYRIVGDSTWRRLLPKAVPQNVINEEVLSNLPNAVLKLSTNNIEQYPGNASCQEISKMDDNEPVLVTGEVETIIIQPDSIDLLFDNEDPYWSDQDLNDSEAELSNENCINTSLEEQSTINYEDLVQTPFCLENYFLNNDVFRSRSPCLPIQSQIIEIDRVTCYECDIVFCNEHKLLEHLMTHIEVDRMGCDICDKDLNLEEKFQLHIMAVTWQSIYYCDFCRKSCAGVVRSKSQPPPPGKTYMCHDCENQSKQLTVNFQSVIQFQQNVISGSLQKSLKSFSYLPTREINSFSLQLPSSSPELISVTNSSNIPILSSAPSCLPSLPLLQPPNIFSPPPSEVLQDHKQKPVSEFRQEALELNTTHEAQDCFKTLMKKENNKFRRPKPRVQVVSESMKQTLKMSTRSCKKNKSRRDCKCHYCPVAFSENFLLKTHLHEQHKFHKLRYVCNLCDKEFVQQRNYEDHVSLHHATKNHFCCFVCNLTFLSERELMQHQKIHRKNEIIKGYCDNTNNIVALDLRKNKSKKKKN